MGPEVIIYVTHNSVYEVLLLLKIPINKSYLNTGTETKCWMQLSAELRQFNIVNYNIVIFIKSLIQAKINLLL